MYVMYVLVQYCLHIRPLSKNALGISTYLLRKYSATPFPSPSILSDDAMPPLRLSSIRLELFISMR